MARMIYHVPYPLQTEATTGSALRPVRMLEAFRDIGYAVEVISGESAERRASIKLLRRKIENGEKYDFVYSESHTMPTALTDRDHIPRRPLMDVSFLKFCRKHGIRVGLFYRDIYWRFPEYKQRLHPLVHLGTRALYNFDLLAYKSAVDYLYLPSLGMGKFVPYFPVERHRALPPGGEISDAQKSQSSTIRLFYVGGVGGYYNMRDCVRAVAASKNAYLTICTSEAQWLEAAPTYQEFMNDRIEVVHKHGDDLVPFYEQADACMLFIEPSVYRSFAAPIKFAEYIGFGKPVIANEGTNVAEFLEEHGNGWSVPFQTNALTDLLNDLAENPDLILDATRTALDIREDNTWQARARQVAQDLS